MEENVIYERVAGFMVRPHATMSDPDPEFLFVSLPITTEEFRADGHYALVDARTGDAKVELLNGKLRAFWGNPERLVDNTTAFVLYKLCVIEEVDNRVVKLSKAITYLNNLLWKIGTEREKKDSEVLLVKEIKENLTNLAKGGDSQ